MPNVGQILKIEISRLSRKEVRDHIQPVRNATAAQRKQLVALRKQVAELQRQVAVLQRHQSKGSRAKVENGSSHRYSSKGLISLRKRLALSAEQMGRLIGVGAQTIYSWEGEKTSPRQPQISAIAALRKIGKREAQRRLAESPVA